MKNLSQKIWIAVFCAALGLPFLVFNLFSDKLSMDNHENRLLTGLPTVLHSAHGELISNLDAFLVDNSPFRYQLVVLNASIDYALFGTSQSDQVLPGKQGWLFYRDGPNAAQPVANYQGVAEIDDDAETLSLACTRLQALSDTLAQHGCTLVLDITPSKDRIYRRYMPDGYPVVSAQNRTDRLAQALADETSVQIHWPYRQFCEEVEEQPERLLYYKTDTHWNSLGALLALDGILEQLGMETCPFDSYRYQPGEIVTGDMANVAALYKILPDEHAVEVTDYAELFAQDGRTVGVLGDSFSEYYMPYLSCRFAGSWRQTLDTLTPELAANPGCDVLILEANERSVDTLLDLLEQF